MLLLVKNSKRKNFNKRKKSCSQSMTNNLWNAESMSVKTHFSQPVISVLGLILTQALGFACHAVLATPNIEVTVNVQL